MMGVEKVEKQLETERLWDIISVKDKNKKIESVILADNRRRTEGRIKSENERNREKNEDLRWQWDTNRETGISAGFQSSENSP